MYHFSHHVPPYDTPTVISRILQFVHVDIDCSWSIAAVLNRGLAPCADLPKAPVALANRLVDHAGCKKLGVGKREDSMLADAVTLQPHTTMLRCKYGLHHCSLSSSPYSSRAPCGKGFDSPGITCCSLAILECPCWSGVRFRAALQLRPQTETQPLSCWHKVIEAVLSSVRGTLLPGMAPGHHGHVIRGSEMRACDTRHLLCFSKGLYLEVLFKIAAIIVIQSGFVSLLLLFFTLSQQILNVRI